MTATPWSNAARCLDRCCPTLVLILGVLIVAFPLYLTFVASTHTPRQIVQAPMPLLPGSHLIGELHRRAGSAAATAAGSNAPVARMMMGEPGYRR